MEKKISIVVPCYNVEKYISKCLDSLINQTLARDQYEIVCVNDCSVDQTLALLKDYESRYEDLLILVDLEQNIGVSAARNLGLSYANGKYLMYVDGDDFVENSILEKLLEISQNDNFDVVESIYDIWREEENGNVVKENMNPFEPFIFQDGISSFSRGELLKEVWNSGSSLWGKLYRKDFLIDNQIECKESLRFAEDVPYTGEVRLLCRNYYRTNYQFYHYLLRENGSNSCKRSSEEIMSCPQAIIELMQDISKSEELQKAVAQNYEAFETFCIKYLVFDPAKYAFYSFSINEAMELIYALIKRCLVLFPKAADNLYLNSINSELTMQILKIMKGIGEK